MLVAQLKMFKGTDASWKDDIEPPAEEIEFSDDEAERAARMGRGGRRGRGRRGRGGIDSTEPGPPGTDGDAIPCSMPQREPRKRRAFNPSEGQSPYVPAQVSGFGPPSYGHYGSGNHQYRGRGLGRGGPRGGGRFWAGPPPPYNLQPSFRPLLPTPESQQHFFPQQQSPMPFQFYGQASLPPRSLIHNGTPPQFHNRFSNSSQIPLMGPQFLQSPPNPFQRGPAPWNWAPPQ